MEVDGDIVLTDTEIRDNVILFADTLLKYLKKYKASPKGKENFKWEGNFDDLKAFVSLILKAEGDWSGSEEKSTGKLIFKEKHGKFCLNWWKSKHILLFQGKPEEVTKYEDLPDKLMYGGDVSNKKKHGGTKPRPIAKSTKSVIIEVTHSSADNTVGFVEAEEEDTEETVVIAGDSVLKGQKGWLMSRQKNVKCKTFSGSTCSDMDHYLNPIISRKPDYLFLHEGTNYLPNYSPDEVTNMIRNLAIKVRNNNINCHVSSLIVPVDKPDLNEKVKMVNSKLKDMLESENINLITHQNISRSHLNCRGLRLNKRGDAALADNFIKTIRNVPQCF